MTTQNAAAHHYNLGHVRWQQNQTKQAIAHFRRCVDARPDWNDAHQNLGMLQLLTGNFVEGWRGLEYRQRVAEPPGQPRWTGQPLDGETIVVLGEQGHGDIFQFIRYVPLLAQRGATVVLAVPQNMHRILGTLEGVDRFVTPARPDLPARFYHVAVMSLPFVFATTLETIPPNIPYLHANAAPWLPFLRSLRGRLKIGLVWAGRSREYQADAVEIDRHRSMRLADMLPLFDISDCSFVSLQLGPPAEQIRDLPPRIDLHDVANRLQSWADTAELIMGLDLVVTVDTAVAHLAGALGKPVWMLSRFSGCWRWLTNRSDSPWYPTMRIFRQPKPGDWASVIADVRKHLTVFACKN